MIHKKKLHRSKINKKLQNTIRRLSGNKIMILYFIVFDFIFQFINMIILLIILFIIIYNYNHQYYYYIFVKCELTP